MSEWDHGYTEERGKDQPARPGMGQLWDGEHTAAQAQAEGLGRGVTTAGGITWTERPRNAQKYNFLILNTGSLKISKVRQREKK